MADRRTARDQAIADLAFLLCTVRCGERLNDKEEDQIRATIQRLKDEEPRIAALLTADDERIELNGHQVRAAEAAASAGADVALWPMELWDWYNAAFASDSITTALSKCPRLEAAYRAAVERG